MSLFSILFICVSLAILICKARQSINRDFMVIVVSWIQTWWIDLRLVTDRQPIKTSASYVLHVLGELISQKACKLNPFASTSASKGWPDSAVEIVKRKMHLEEETELP